MSVFKPAYRLKVFAPRSFDATETTVLTPAAGAPHADPFVVTSIQGVAGSKPYLDTPQARGGTIDALNKKTSIGSITVRILDARVTVGGGNAARWVAAFLGDGFGGNNFLGRRVTIEQSVDAGATWAAYFTGRISGQQLDGKQWVQLSLRDIADDLNLDVFVGAPHAATVAYAALAQVAPLGLLRPVRTAATTTSAGTGYAGFPLTTAIRGKTTAPNAGVFGIDVDPTNGDPYRTIFTQALVDATMRVLGVGSNSANTNLPGGSAQPPKVMIAAAGSGVYVEYDLDQVQTTNSSINTANQLFFTTSLTRLIAKQTNKAGAAAAPATGTSIDFYIVDPLAQPSDRTPLLIDDVNAVTYLTHLCSGYFGRLDAAGNPLRPVPINAASFAAIDTTNFIPWRVRITKASKLNTELEAVCLAYHLAYFVDSAGAINLVDLRRSAVTAPVATLTDADLIAGTDELNWQQDRESAVTSFLGTYYPEHQVPTSALPKPFDRVGSLEDLPDVPSIGVVELAGLGVLTSEIGPRSADMKPSALKVDAKGFRFRIDSALKTSEHYPETTSQLRADFIRNAFIAYSDEISGPFGLGPSYIDVVCRRASANVALVTQGKYAALSLSVLPDPATNQRGGARLALCISRTEEGPNVKLRLLDAGANSVALAPTLGVPTVSGTSVSLPVTLNAAAEPVRVSYAVTDTSVAVAPADNDPAWLAGPLLTAAATATVNELPSSQRIWLRARSQPGSGKGFKLPSAWVVPTPAHLDITLLPAPSALAVTGATLDAQILTWTNGDPTAGVDVFMKAGGLPLLARDGTRQAPTLAPGTTQFRLRALTNGATYTVAVRHHDAKGGLSTLASLTFTVSATTATLKPPTNPTGFSGSQDPTHGLPQADGSYGLAVAAVVFPGFTEFLEAVETAPGSGVYGTAVTVGVVPNVQGDWTSWRNVAPDDGLRRQLSARHTSDGTTASTYTVAIPVQPWSAQPLGAFKTTSEIRPFSAFGELGSGDDTETIQRAIDWSAAGNGEVGQAGTFNIDGLVFRDGMRLICPGRTSTTFVPVAAPAALAAILLDQGPVQKLAAEGFTVDMTAYPTQHGIYLKAVPIFVSGATQGGLWYSRFKDVWVVGCTAESFWLRGGGDALQGPHQFLKFQAVVVETAATSSGALAGHALRLSGQVGQLDFDADCRFDGISRSTAGVNILIERTVDDTGANNGDASPYSIALPVTCQSRDRLATVERGLNVSFDGAHFEEAPEGVHVDVSAGQVTVQGAFYSNVGSRGDGTGFCARCDSGQLVVGDNFFGGTVETHYIRRFGGSLTLRGGDADSSNIRTSGVTPVIAAAATIDTGYSESALISGGPTTAIKTITSQLAVGKSLTLRANGADITFDTGGNIGIGSGLDYRLPVRVKQDQAITLKRHDVSSAWVISNISGARGAYRQEPVFVNHAASPFTIPPGSGSVRADTGAGDVTLVLPSNTDAPPGFRIAVKKVASNNTVFINGATSGQNPDGLATNACTLTGLNQSIEFERNGVSGSGGWDIVSGGALAGSLVVDSVAAGNPSSTVGVLSVRESASHGYGLVLQNRNATRTWGIAVDAVAIDDGIITINDLTAGASRLSIDTSGLVTIPQALTVTGAVTAGSLSTAGTLASGAHTISTTGGLTGLAISDATSHSALSISPATGGTAFIDNRRVAAPTIFRSSNASSADRTWLTVTAAGNASFAFSVTISTGQLNITAGGIVTQAPTGGTSATWKLGTYVAAGVTLDTTHYVEAEIGGTLRKLAVVT